MAKNVFDPIDVIEDSSIAYIEAPSFTPHLVSAIEEVVIPSYDGPSADELRIEAEAFTSQWEEEKSTMIAEATKQATAIIQDASEKAEAMAVQVDNDIIAQKESLKIEQAEILATAAADTERMRNSVQLEINVIKESAIKEGQALGHEEGYKEGYQEVERLIERLHIIINRTIDKRNDIFDEVETQVIELTLLMVRKVVKVIAENEKNVVINNIIQALKKLKSRSDVTIRVSLDDIDIASEHMNRFTSSIEGNGVINFIEDSSIEKGGCIVETDFGEIDARISSQLGEIENRIRDLMPINIRPKVVADDRSLYGE